MVRSIVLRVFDPRLELKELNSILNFLLPKSIARIKWKIHHSIRRIRILSSFKNNPIANCVPFLFHLLFQ